MSRSSTRCLGALVVGGAMALLLAPAQAATERVVESYRCVDFPDGLVLCDVFTMQYNSVETPSGVRIYNGRYTYDYSITGPGYDFTGSTVSKSTRVYGKGANVVRDFTFDVSVENGVTCTFERKLIFSGGSVRVHDLTDTCA